MRAVEAVFIVHLSDFIGVFGVFVASHPSRGL